MILLQQILILFSILLASIVASGGLFWLLFKKDAPSYEEIKERFLVDID